MAARSWRSRTRVMANASVVGCSTMTVQRGVADASCDCQHPTARRIVVDPIACSRLSGGVARNVAAIARSGSAPLVGAAISRFLSGLPCAMKLPSSATSSAYPSVADANAIDHAPELLERDLGDEPARVTFARAEPDRDHCGRQNVLVELQRRDVDA